VDSLGIYSSGSNIVWAADTPPNLACWFSMVVAMVDPSAGSKRIRVTLANITSGTRNPAVSSIGNNIFHETICF
jgi:hypothetical protein